MKTKLIRLCATVFGFVLLIGGVFFVKADDAPQGILRAIPYLCIAIGCSLFGSGLSGWLSNRAIRGEAKITKQIEIEKKDERNVTIMNQAKGKAFDLMSCVFGALIWAIALIGADTILVLLLFFAYLFVLGAALFYRIKYEKEQ